MLALSKALLKDSKHLTSLKSHHQFYSILGELMKGKHHLKTWTNVSYPGSQWRRYKWFVSAGWPYRKPNLIVKVSVIQSQLLHGVSPHQTAAKIVRHLVNYSSPSSHTRGLWLHLPYAASFFLLLRSDFWIGPAHFSCNLENPTRAQRGKHWQKVSSL